MPGGEVKSCPINKVKLHETLTAMTAEENRARIEAGLRKQQLEREARKDRMPEIAALLVDDDPVFRQMLQEQIESICQQRCIVFQAASGKEAIETLGQVQVDYLFLDLRMPKPMGDGIELLKAIDRTKMVVLVVTGIPDDAPEIALAREMGVRFIIRKSELASDLPIIFGL